MLSGHPIVYSCDIYYEVAEVSSPPLCLFGPNCLGLRTHGKGHAQFRVVVLDLVVTRSVADGFGVSHLRKAALIGAVSSVRD